MPTFRFRSHAMAKKALVQFAQMTGGRVVSGRYKSLQVAKRGPTIYSRYGGELGGRDMATRSIADLQLPDPDHSWRKPKTREVSVWGSGHGDQMLQVYAKLQGSYRKSVSRHPARLVTYSPGGPVRVKASVRKGKRVKAHSRKRSRK